MTKTTEPLPALHRRRVWSGNSTRRWFVRAAVGFRYSILNMGKRKRESRSSAPTSKTTSARFVDPMLLLRTDSVPAGEQWLYELKLDGTAPLLSSGMAPSICGLGTTTTSTH